MKQPKRLTRKQKICLSVKCIDADEWMLIEETEFCYKLIHKKTGKIEIILKFKKEKRN